MRNASDKQAEWNRQAIGSSDPAAQVARPGNDTELDDLVADIRGKLLIDGSADSILDVGCGNGLVLSKLSGRFNRICGIDYAENMIARARELVPRGEFSTGDASALEFPDNSFSRVLCYSIFHYFPDREYASHALAELVRVCEPGGVLLIGDVLDANFEQEIKSSTDLDYEKEIPSIHRYSEWRFYDLNLMVRQVPGKVRQAEILEQPENFKMSRYRKDLRICR